MYVHEFSSGLHYNRGDIVSFWISAQGMWGGICLCLSYTTGMLFCTSYPRGFIAQYELQEEEYYLSLSYVRVYYTFLINQQKGCYLSPIVNGRDSLYLSYFRVILYYLSYTRELYPWDIEPIWVISVGYWTYLSYIRGILNLSELHPWDIVPIWVKSVDIFLYKLLRLSYKIRIYFVSVLYTEEKRWFV